MTEAERLGVEGRWRPPTETERGALGLTDANGSYVSPDAHPARARCHYCRCRPGERVWCVYCNHGVGPGCCLWTDLPRAEDYRRGICVRCQPNGGEQQPVAQTETTRPTTTTTTTVSTGTQTESSLGALGIWRWKCPFAVWVLLCAFVFMMTGRGDRCSVPERRLEAVSQPERWDRGSESLGCLRVMSRSEHFGETLPRTSGDLKEEASTMPEQHGWAFSFADSLLWSSETPLRSRLGTNLSLDFSLQASATAQLPGQILTQSDRGMTAEPGAGAQRREGVRHRVLRYLGFYNNEYTDAIHEPPEEAPARGSPQYETRGAGVNGTWIDMDADRANLNRPRDHRDSPRCPVRETKGRVTVDRHDMVTARGTQRRFRDHAGRGFLTLDFHCWWCGEQKTGDSWHCPYHQTDYCQ